MSLLAPTTRTGAWPGLAMTRYAAVFAWLGGRARTQASLTVTPGPSAAAAVTAARIDPRAASVGKCSKLSSCAEPVPPATS